MFIGGYVGSILANMLAYCACSACQCASREVLRRSARVAWASLFFMAMIVAWLMRDFAKPLMEKIPWIVRGATQEDIDRYYGQQAVYRVSMGNFLFFSVMAVALLGVKYKSDKRDQFLHHGNWLLKLGLWLLFTALPFLFPNSVMDVYGWAARVGSGFFLVIQMVILLDFVQCWNDAWAASGDENPNFLYALMGLTVAAYSGALTLAGFLYHWFKPAGAGSCSLNILLITFSLLMVVVISVLSLHPVARNGSIFPAAMVGLYCMYLTASALMSEPRDYQCNGMGQRVTAASGSTLAGGMLFTLAAVVYAAFRAGSNTHLFTLEGSEDGETSPERTALLTSAGLDGEAPPPQGASREIDTESRAIDEYKPVTYNYSFFHLIFALASMYIAMLMTGWGSAVQEKDRIDVGWASVWVKTTAHWVTGLLYCWTLMAPAMFPDRDFA